MKILHLNAYFKNGGAGKAAFRLSQALRDAGMDSTLGVNYTFEALPQGTSLLNPGFSSKLLKAAGILSERYYSASRTKAAGIPFSIPLWGQDLSRHPLVHAADILHLHWINHAFLRPEDLAKLAALKKKIVWTFHDSNAFTGGCHVRYNCTHYHESCGNCPVLKDSHPQDWSNRIWKRKAQAYPTLDLHIVAPSRWMKTSVEKSSLLGGRPVHVIPNTLDIQVFSPADKRAARQALGLDPEKNYLLAGFMPSKNDRHKGSGYVIESIEKLDPANRQNLELLIFGNKAGMPAPELPISCRLFGQLGEEAELAKLYQAADLFLAPSLEDNLPYTVMESLSCGTPVVAFRTGGIPDMVEHEQNGFLADQHDAEQLAEGIRRVLEHPDKLALQQACRQKVMSTYSPGTVARQHIQLYENLIHG